MAACGSDSRGDRLPQQQEAAAARASVPQQEMAVAVGRLWLPRQREMAAAAGPSVIAVAKGQWRQREWDAAAAKVAYNGHLNIKNPNGFEIKDIKDIMYKVQELYLL